MARTIQTAAIMTRNLRNRPWYRKKKLAEFCTAVREKPNWYFDLLDATQEAGKKWAVEAEIMSSEDDTSESAQLVLLALEDLKNEASAIRALDHTIRLGSGTIPAADVDFDAIDADIQVALKFARGAKHAVRVPELREEVGVFISDDLVPASLHKELIAALDGLTDCMPKDFLPGTHGKVQGLIHPSLHPYIADVTPIADSVSRPQHKDGNFKTVLRKLDFSEYITKYAWIPSIFRISDDGTDVEIASYINGLGPRERFPALYRLIERVFLLVLPQLEKTMQFTHEHKESDSLRRWKARQLLRIGTSRQQWKEMLDKQQREKEKNNAERIAFREAEDKEAAQERSNISQFSDVDASSSLKGQCLKVIVKAANYCLKPGQTYDGKWHMEGLPHERIVASAIYYYDADPFIADHGLGLRRTRDRYADFPNVEEITEKDFAINLTANGNEESLSSEDILTWDYPSDSELDSDSSTTTTYDPTEVELSSSIALGVVSTAHVDGGTGRIVSYPSWIQRRMEGIVNGASKTKANQDVKSRRKILCFYVVADNDTSQDTKQYPGFAYEGLAGLNVLTTADVPAQSCGTNKPTLRFLLPAVCIRLIGKALPPELVEYIVDAADLGVTRAEAMRIRWDCMLERKGPKGFDVLGETYAL